MSDSVDTTPRWRAIRNTVFRHCPYAEGAIIEGDLDDRARISDIEPLNSAARRSLNRFCASPPPLPLYEAAHNLEAGGFVRRAGTTFQSDRWPPRDGSWKPANDSARAVTEYANAHRGHSLPRLSWTDNAVNTIEAEKARNYRPPPDPPPQRRRAV